MALLTRKISLPKWSDARELAAGEIAADAVTADLRTQGNALSFWRCSQPTREELEQTVLAIAAGAERLDRFDIAWLDEEGVRNAGLATRDTAGLTPAIELKDRHVDIERLDLERLSRLARLTADAIQNDQHLRLPKAEVRNLLLEALRTRRVQAAHLHENLRQELEVRTRPPTAPGSVR